MYQSELRRVLLLSLLLCDEEEIVSVLGDPDESTLSNTRRSLKQRKRRREKNQEYHQRGRVRVPSSISNNFSLHLFFSPLVNPLFSVAFFPPRMPRPHSCLRSSLPPSLPLVLILPSSSAVIHPGQTTIPYKAGGSPHLASYFHIRSAVTDRVYTGSSLECEAAFSFSCATNLSVLRGTNLGKPPPSSSFSASLPPLLPPVFSQLHLPLICRYPSISPNHLNAERA